MRSSSQPPSVHFLPYLTTGESPTRIRLIASRGLKIAAGIAATGAASALLVTILFAITYWPAYAASRSLPDALLACIQNLSPGLLLAGLLAIITTLLLTCATSVLRGNRRAANTAAAALLPFQVLLLFAAALFAVYFLTAITHFRHDEPSLLSLLGLLCIPLSPAAALALCLAGDLSLLLQWIAQQPTIDHPLKLFTLRRSPDT